MIGTVIKISLLRLWHNKAELILTFVVPILFFCIFALIFGSRSGATPQLKIAICDQVRSDLSRATIQGLTQSPSLSVREPQVNRAGAELLVRRGQVAAAIVFVVPDSNAETIRLRSLEPETRIEIWSDSFDQVAGQVIAAMVQQSSMAAQATVAAKHRRIEATSPGSIAVSSVSLASSVSSDEPPFSPLQPTIAMVDVMGQKKSNPVVAMYAAGIAVMFLLFSTTTASGSLLDERENSTLERLLCSRMTMDHLLMGKWCYLVMIGILQTSIMFLTGALFFHLNLMDHLDGFAAMTIVTAGAGASFALMLAALCRTRTQLGWVSTVVILSMSALGGSMVPRYLMSESIQKVGQFTFNAWALDGYNKVFWRELPIGELRNEMAVLVVCGFVFMVIARVFATRWDRT